MKILDLFCGAGGASMGYHQSFPEAEIVGIDHKPQPNYTFKFIQADATALDIYDDYDLIHASPPCQAFSTLKHSAGAKEYTDWEIPFIRQILKSTGKAYVMENVPGAPLLNPVTLCGSMFSLVYHGYELRRHRLIETSFPVQQPPCAHEYRVLGVYGDLAKQRRASTRGVKAGHEDAKHLMGIGWMTSQEITQAIPPAYTRYIANQMQHLYGYEDRHYCDR